MFRTCHYSVHVKIFVFEEAEVIQHKWHNHRKESNIH